MHQLFDSLLLTIEQSSIFGYSIIFLVFFFESLAFVGLAVPGTVFLVLSGFMAARDLLDANILLVLIFSAIILGDGTSFYLGERGKAFFRVGNKIFKSSYLEKGEEFFRAHGNKSVILGRFIGPMRPLVSFISGLFKMDIGKFYLFNVAGAVLWIAAYFSIGFFFGQAAKAIEIWSTRVGVFLLFLALFFVAVYLVKRYVTKRSTAIFLFAKSVSSSIKEAVLENDDVRRVVGKHPRFFAFLAGRFDRGIFTGLPLTLLSVAFAYVAMLFLGVVEAVLTSEAIVEADIRIVNLLFSFRDSSLAEFFIWVTMLGSWKLILIFSLIASMIFWIWKKRFFIVSLWATISGAMFFSFIGKLAFQRARPEGGLFFEKSFSFPSGHATMSAAFYGFVIYFFWMNLSQWKNKINILFANMLLIALIGFSRLYLGVHFLSDVWGGVLLGLLCLITGITIGEWFYLKIGAAIAGYEADAKARIVTSLLLFLALASYIAMVLAYKPHYLLYESRTDHKVIAGTADLFAGEKLPRYSETLVGSLQEPLSFVIAAKEEGDLVKVFERAGWYLPDQFNANVLIKMGKAAFFNESYPKAPITPSFWNATTHDYGFQKPTLLDNIKERHHIRFWDTGYKTADGRMIFVGTASLDIGIKWWVAHKIDPDIDTEREYVFSDLLKTGLIANWNKAQFVEPILGKNFGGDLFFTDGNIYFLSLR